MTFMANLAANPSGSGVYGAVPQETNEDALGIFNRIRDRDMQDFQTKANFMSDLSLKQDRLKKIYDQAAPTGRDIIQGQAPPAQSTPSTGLNPANTSMNTQVDNSGQIDPLQQAQLSQRQQQIGIESQKVAQAGKFGQEALDIKSKQEALNQQKSDQIKQQKENELNAKIAESEGKLKQAQQALTDKTKTAEEQLNALKEYHKLVDERKALEDEKKDREHDANRAMMQKKIDEQEAALKQKGHTKTTVTDSTGASRTTETTRGDQGQPAPKRNADGTYHVVSPDGQEGDIPPDKLDDWMSNHQTQASQ